MNPNNQSSITRRLWKERNLQINEGINFKQRELTSKLNERSCDKSRFEVKIGLDGGGSVKKKISNWINGWERSKKDRKLTYLNRTDPIKNVIKRNRRSSCAWSRGKDIKGQLSICPIRRESIYWSRCGSVSICVWVREYLCVFFVCLCGFEVCDRVKVLHSFLCSSLEFESVIASLATSCWVLFVSKFPRYIGKGKTSFS